MSTALEDQLGQLFLLRVREARWNAALERELRRLQPGGLFPAVAIPDSPDSTSEFISSVARALAHRPFLPTSHTVFAGFLPELPLPRFAARKSLASVTRLGELSGVALSVLGFNVNNAPHLDVYTRLFGKRLGGELDDPIRVAKIGNAFLRGLARLNVLPWAGIFPGQGCEFAPTGYRGGLPLVSKPMAALWREDLVPYRKLLPRLPMIRVSTWAYKAYDFDQPRPACRSSAIVTGLLRDKLGYQGLAVALSLYADSGPGDTGLAAVEAIEAGCDLLIVDEGEYFEKPLGALKVALESGRISAERIEQSLQRIRAVKRRLAMPPRKFSLAAWKQLEQRYVAFSREFKTGD
jgi:beta-N-acetylhexosaminidase